jgi:hypothetical protein
MPHSAYRQPGQAPAEYLAVVVADACVAARGIAPELEAYWQALAKELAAGLITSASSRDWLSLQADYWGPKDREYANYLRQLASTFRA